MMRKSFVRYPLIFIAPAFVMYLVFFMIPNITGMYYSVTDLSTYSDVVKFIGLTTSLDCFARAFSPRAIQNTLLYAVCVTVFVNLFGLALALMLNERPRLGNLYRTVFFTPYVIAPLIVGYIFTAIYQPEVGILNRALRGIGLGALAADWLNDPKIALVSIIMTELWRSSGFAMVIYLAGLKTIPGSPRSSERGRSHLLQEVPSGNLSPPGPFIHGHRSSDAHQFAEGFRDGARAYKRWPRLGYGGFQHIHLSQLREGQLGVRHLGEPRVVHRDRHRRGCLPPYPAPSRGGDMKK